MFIQLKNQLSKHEAGVSQCGEAFCEAWIITIQICVTSFTPPCPLYVSDGPNSWVSMAGGGPYSTPGSCVGSGHSEEYGTPYTGGQVTNSRRGKSAHLINLFSR